MIGFVEKRYVGNIIDRTNIIQKYTPAAHRTPVHSYTYTQYIYIYIEIEYKKPLYAYRSHSSILIYQMPNMHPIIWVNMLFDLEYNKKPKQMKICLVF